MANHSEIIIGDFFPQPVTGRRVFISVYADHPAQGEYLVYDKTQKIVIKDTFSLVSEGDALEIPANDLHRGIYTVLIRIGSRKWSRTILIGDKKKSEALS